jgi:acetyl esterase/lipase
MSTPRAPKRIHTSYTKVADLIYTPPEWPQALKADVFRPKCAGPWPGVVLIHGGSWSMADNRWHMAFLARKLAKRGYVVMNVMYRGTPEFRFPAPVDDIREAVRWLRAHAAEYALNDDKLATYGFSAGGHLAAFVGLHEAETAVRAQAVVAASAPTVFTLYPENKTLEHFLGTTYAEKPEAFRDGSPISYVTSASPPVFQYHGTEDTTVSPKHSIHLKAALDAAGVRNELRWLPGRRHASVLLFARAAENAAIDFLDSVLR